MPGVRRSRVHQRADDLGEAAEGILEPGEGAGVGGGEAADLLLRGGDVLAEQQPLPIREPVQRRTGGVDRDPALVEPHVPPDRLAEHADHVGPGRCPEPGRELLGHAAAADELAALEDQRLQPGAGEVEAGDETVVAPADDHGVVAVRCRHQLSSRLIRASR